MVHFFSMDDIKKQINDTSVRLEKEGTPVRSVATWSRLFVEQVYKTSMAAFSPVKVTGLYAERVNLASVSMETFKRNNKVREDGKW